jgi:lysophospholipase L1-like esterase
MLKSYFFGVIFLITSYANAQEIELFKKGDRVCFVGNSITNNGEFYHNIFQFFVTRYPSQEISFFNCGISGDATSGILKRIGSDIMVNKPTHAVIMIGMNDVNRGLYGPKPSADVDTLQKRAAAIANYKTNLDNIVRILLANKVNVILQKPSIYDQTALLPIKNNLGVNDALKICADFCAELGKKYKIPTVDYWTILSKINADLQLKDPKSTIIGKDRVHPLSLGHFIMTYEFLKSMKTSKYVSNIEIDAQKLKPKGANKEELSFSVLEKSLPFPKVEIQQQGFDLVPFNNELNVELLNVKNLIAGNYQLYIDTIAIGNFSHKQLQLGINLSDYAQTPQYQQALAVHQMLVNLWKAESDLRSITYVEFKFLTGFKQKGDLSAVKVYLDDLFKRKLSDTYFYKIQFDKYQLVKPKQKELLNQFDKFRKDAYKMAQPQKHSYTLKRN